MVAKVVVVAAPELTNEVLEAAGNTTVLLPNILKLFPDRARLGVAEAGRTTVLPPLILKLLELMAKLGEEEIVKVG